VGFKREKGGSYSEGGTAIVGYRGAGNRGLLWFRGGVRGESPVKGYGYSFFSQGERNPWNYGNFVHIHFFELPIPISFN
jgi:hypothetical protein